MYWRTLRSYRSPASTSHINHLNETIGKYRVNRARNRETYVGSRMTNCLLGIADAGPIVLHYASWWFDKSGGEECEVGGLSEVYLVRRRRRLCIVRKEKLGRWEEKRDR